MTAINHPVADWQVARSLVEPLYAGEHLNSGEGRLEHSDGMVKILQTIREDNDLFTAAYLFSATDYIENADDWIEKKFGPAVLGLVKDMHRLMSVSERARSEDKEAQAVYQPEALGRMVLAMCHDLRVVVLRLASRLQTLRWFAAQKTSAAARYGEETLAIYAPLANRLGIWQMKWELEDLAFSFTCPQEYEDISKHLSRSREARVDFMRESCEKLKTFLNSHGIQAEVSGRPKHIYSIYKKMQRKHLEFDELYDIHAMRVIVDTVEQCYATLSIVQETFQIVSKEFDDYIANPKPNGYQSLHTVILDGEGRPIEVQIRTRAMHDFAELGVAAHWRYKEKGNSEKDENASSEDQKIAWLRQLIAWRSDVELPQAQGFKEDFIYALTPQGRVLELPAGSTPVDFAYLIHTQLGHRCRGAKIDGVMVPLNTPIKTAQTVEIITVKEGGPSRDWLNPELGYAASPRTRTKVRQWFNAQTLAEQVAAGRERLDKELARLGKTAVNLEELSERLGFDDVEGLYVAIAKEELSSRAIEQVLEPEPEEPDGDKDVLVSSRASHSKSNVLVVGMDSLMTQLARCCHPAPPDEIIGFVTRGKGVTIHRLECPNVRNLTNIDQDRIIEVSWGTSEDAVYPVDLIVVARDRDGLIKDISEIFVRETIRLIGINAMSVKGDAHLRLSIEIRNSDDLKRALSGVRELKGVMSARRA